MLTRPEGDAGLVGVGVTICQVGGLDRADDAITTAS
jgi:hypothetical protein